MRALPWVGSALCALIGCSNVVGPEGAEHDVAAAIEARHGEPSPEVLVPPDAEEATAEAPVRLGLSPDAPGEARAPLDAPARELERRIPAEAVIGSAVPSVRDRVALERAIAADDARYLPRQDGAGPVLVGPAGRARLLASFDASGAEVAIGEHEVRIRAAALGRPEAMRALATASAPAIEGPEVRTTRASGVVEWWRSLPSGLEHGVTIAERLPGTGELAIDLAFDGALRARELSPTSIELVDSAGARVATYSDLLVLDASGVELPARMAVAGPGVRITVDDESATYPLVVDPTLGVFLEGTVSSFAGSIALDATGARIVAGGGDTSSAVVYVRSGTTWALERSFSITGSRSVAIDGAGSRVLLGRPSTNEVRVFTRSGTTWTEAAPLLPPVAVTGSTRNFGAAVALSADGARAFVGAPGDAGLLSAGRVHVFLTSGALEQTLSASGTFRNFGGSVAAAADGSRFIAGTYSSTGSGTGGAYVFLRSGSAWAEEANPSAGAVNSVALASDASRAAITINSGPVRVYLRSSTTWTLEQEFTTSSSFVALSGDGSRLLKTPGYTGSASLFVRSGTSWSGDNDVGCCGSHGAFASDGTRFAHGESIYRVGTPLAIGAACSIDANCASGHCVDGVCCATACGFGSTTDCQACSMALTGVANGTCAPLTAAAAATVVCRASAGPCDVEERCTGGSAACPGDARQPSTHVCRGPTSACDLPEYCSGTATTCPSPGPAAPAGTVCRASAGSCDPQELCDGTSYTCPADVLSPNGTSCGASATSCSTGGTCNGTSAMCQGGGPRPAGTICLPATPGNPCDVDDVCDGVTDACVPRFAPASTACGPAPSGACDLPDHCAGDSATCVPMFDAGTVCRPAAGACDIPEVCSGGSASCPPDTLLSAGVVCRDSAGDCDLAELCTGSAAACPPDAFRSSSVVCRAAVTPCDVAEQCPGSGATCPADAFAPSGTVCNGFLLGPCDAPDVCTGTSSLCPEVYRSDVVCRPAAGACDVAESCTGASASCPPDTLVAAGIECGGATGSSCSTPGTCSGTSATCPGASPLPAGTVCLPADPSSACDVDDVCDGVSDACQPAYRPAGHVCAESGGDVCDAPDVCAGTSADCVPTFLTDVVCRPALGVCDVEETCSGDAPSCPPDGVLAAGVSCRGSSVACDPEEVCDGVATSCPADVSDCADAGAEEDGGSGTDGGVVAIDGGRDAGSGRDASLADAELDGDAGLPPPAAGCACRAGRSSDAPLGLLLVALVLAVRSARRRRAGRNA